MKRRLVTLGFVALVGLQLLVVSNRVTTVIFAAVVVVLLGLYGIGLRRKPVPIAGDDATPAATLRAKRPLAHTGDSPRLRQDDAQRAGPVASQSDGREQLRHDVVTLLDARHDAGVGRLIAVLRLREQQLREQALDEVLGIDEP
jgi:hypothetical protein